MRNTPLRAFAKKSPYKKTGAKDVIKDIASSDAAKTSAKQVAKQTVKKGVTRLAGRAAGALAGTAGTMLGGAGAAYGLVKGYGNLAKQKHGKQIIKDARMMPGKM